MRKRERVKVGRHEREMRIDRDKKRSQYGERDMAQRGRDLIRSTVYE